MSDFRDGIRAARAQRTPRALRLDITSWEWGRWAEPDPVVGKSIEWHRGWDYAIICAREIYASLPSTGGE